MKKTQRLKYIITAPLFVFAVIIAQFGFTADAEAASRTWTGAGDGTSMSDGQNWSGGVAPGNNDEIVLPARALVTNEAYENVILDFDLQNVQLSAILLENAAGDGQNNKITYYRIDGLVMMDGGLIRSNVMNGGLRADLALPDLNAVGNLEVRTVDFSRFAGTVAGNLTVGTAASMVLPGPDPLNVQGALVVADGVSFTMRDEAKLNASSYAFGKNSTIFISSSTNASLAKPISLSEGAKLYFGVDYQQESATFNVSSPLSISGGAAFIHAEAGVTVNVTSAVSVSNYGQLYIDGETEGIVNLPTLPVFEHKPVAIDGNANTTINVLTGEAGTLNGSRNGIVVYPNASLNGNGTANLIMNYGVMTPGKPYGAMNVSQAYVSGILQNAVPGIKSAGVLRIEALNAQNHSSLVTGSDFATVQSEFAASGVTSPVYLNNDSPLQLALAEGWSFAQGDVITIVNNQSAITAQGTFADLPEGGRISIDGITFAISYVGGDGNDITLTALNSFSYAEAQALLGAPNTGVKLIELAKANPAIVAVLGFLSIAVLFFAVRRTARR